ncbi:MAG: helix-turn-helix domain-containing protein [Streptococcus orisratti]|uniref:helix-turn-helix domain-containing protein n=1 Tax=Streptococcus orisratti TaxID=114652 RepID=UPI002A8594A5|nr:helix-turn-helix domain-containing protein [Streptococcus orisratti]MDY4001092.1 helix-turn-helix domain-containing protein [Streptococcus orisratti]
MTYGIDFRKCVIAYVQSGHTKKETCDLFGIGTDTLHRWEKQLDELALVKRHYFLPLPLIPLNLIQLNDSWLA